MPAKLCICEEAWTETILRTMLFLLYSGQRDLISMPRSADAHRSFKWELPYKRAVFSRPTSQLKSVIFVTSVANPAGKSYN